MDEQMDKDERMIGGWTSKWICLSHKSFLDLNFSATTSAVPAMCSQGRALSWESGVLSPLTS